MRGRLRADQETDLDHLAGQLTALANPRRLHLLRYLVEPHYLEEVASELGVTRQSARAHLQKLVEVGVLRKKEGRGDHGPVTDYIVAPERLFAIQEGFAELGHLRHDPEEPGDLRAITEPLESPKGPVGEPHEPSLVIVHGARIGQVVVLGGRGPWLVGREPSAPVPLDHDPFVSTRHAEVRRAEAAFEVTDLYSSNGTFVDGERVARGDTVPLEHGAILGAGRTLMVFKRPG